MGKNGRTFKEVKEKLTTTEFENFARKIAKQYANFEPHFSAFYFVRQEDITKDCFYKLLEEAIIRGLVSEEEVEKMEQKAIKNQKAHSSVLGKRTINHYRKLRKERDEHLISLFSEEMIKNLAEDFANHPETSKKEFAEKYEISTNVINILLKKAFAENIADDETCCKIEKRSVDKDSSENTKKFFEQLWEKRKEEILQ